MHNKEEEQNLQSFGVQDFGTQNFSQNKSFSNSQNSQDPQNEEEQDPQKGVKITAIIGPTASGKTPLALRLAEVMPCVILSLDSLCVYNKINIASAKPSEDELAQVRHFGVNIVEPSEDFSVSDFVDEYYRALDFCAQNQKELLIVGGSGFYLKALLDGISPHPKVPQNIKNQAKITPNERKFELLKKIDPKLAEKISPQDSYRLARAFEIYHTTKMPPSEYFAANPPKPILKECDLYEISMPKEELQKRIAVRTLEMIKAGLVAEVSALLREYGVERQWIKSIGIAETADYLDRKLTMPELQAQICTHTIQLAKRQCTFNRTQFKEHFCDSVVEIYKKIASKFPSSQ